MHVANSLRATGHFGHSFSNFGMHAWRARRDLNPGSPAPKAGALILARQRALLEIMLMQMIKGFLSAVYF